MSRCMGFLIAQLLLLQSTGSRHMGLVKVVGMGLVALQQVDLLKLGKGGFLTIGPLREVPSRASGPW